MRFHVRLEIEGMTCPLCSQRVGKVIEEGGFSGVRVDFQSGVADFEYSGPKRDLATLLPKIEVSGLPRHNFRARVKDHAALPHGDNRKSR